MLVAENRQYDYIIEEPIYKPKRKVRTNTKSKRKTNRKLRVKYITFTVFGMLIALTILFQYAKLNMINQEILTLESEINQIYMLNDSVEGNLLASGDLSKIEELAKDRLGMVEPTSEQMTTIEVKKSQQVDTVVNETENRSATGFFGTLSKVLDFID